MTMSLPRTAEVTAAVSAYETAGEAFRAAVRSGGHGRAEYDEWRNARARAIEAQGRVVSAFDEADRARVAEHGYLVGEARRIQGVIRDTGGMYPAIPGWRDAWLKRASVFAGHPIDEVDASLIQVPAYPKGRERPWALNLPPLPRYEAEVGRLTNATARR
jgi:hypothetical protein